MLPLIILSMVLAGQSVNGEVVQPTKLFIIPVEPSLFNWTTDITEEFKYTASSLRHPDLPSWMHFLFSRRFNKGFLYGVVPPDHIDMDVQLVAMNRRTYETRKRVVQLIVHEKVNPAAHEVNLKIDNVNVEDLMDPYRMTRLLDVFRDKLWTNSYHDLYVTFLASAVLQGARRPLKPNDGDGVVIRVGSAAPFSHKLLDLQEEVKPLWKIQSCPRDFKRTSVERWFRDEGFMLDWCSFKLMTQRTAEESGSNWAPPNDVVSSAWLEMTKTNLPQRSYMSDLAFSISIPTLIMGILVFMLSFVLCCHHESIDDDDDFIDNLFSYCDKKSSKMDGEGEEEITKYVSVQRGTGTLRSLSQNREQAIEPCLPLSNDITRPTPPPYTGVITTQKYDI